MRLPAEPREWGVEAPLERWASALRQTAARHLNLAFPRLAAAALAMDAARFRFSRIPHLFSQNLRPIDPSLNDDLLSLYGRSEQILSNQFTFLNRTESFERDIDWQCRAASSCWRTELHSFDYALDLALTYRISGEERHARHLRYLIAHWIAANPLLLGSGWLPRAVARRVRNWILAADLAREDWENDSEFLRVVSESLALQSAYLLRHATPRRSAGDVLEHIRALLVASRCYGNKGNGGATLRSTARSLLFDELPRQVPPDGGDIKPWPSAQVHLAQTVIEWLLFDPEGFEPEARDADYLKGEVRKILDLVEGMLLPDGTPPFFGPARASWRGDFTNMAALATVLLADPVWKSLAEKFGILPYMLLGEEGKARFEALPTVPWKPRPFHSPRTGIYRACGHEGSALVVSGRPPASPEDHQDLFGFELFVQGQRVIVDSGAYGPADEDDSFYRAQAHNVLLVDGQPLRVGSVRGLDPSKLDADVGENSESGCHVTALRLLNRDRGFRGLTHARAWFALDQGAWVVLDRLEGTRPGQVTSLLHFYPTFEIEVRGGRAIAHSRTFAVTVTPLGPAQARMAVSQGNQGEFPGWYAPDIGIKHPASVLAQEWTISRMPWVGGYVVVPGTGTDVQLIEIDLDAGGMRLDVSGKRYRLSMSLEGSGEMG